MAPSAELEQRGSNIIGGFHANSAALDHVGALVFIDPLNGSTSEFCTSTLVSPDTVVTAKHCVQGLGFLEAEFGLGFGWAAGPNPSAPLDVIRIASVETAPGDEGGFVELGRDVAVVHLEHPTDIPPAALRPFDAELMGKAMVLVGYGVHGAKGAYDGQRRIGRETVAAVEGRTFEAMLGSFENWVEWNETGETTDADILADADRVDAETLQRYHTEFDENVLLEGHEAVAGLAPTDTQTCFGDSGGPLARIAEDGTFETYGVVSGGIPSNRKVCDYGGVFAMFGPVTFDFLQRALEWVDPCGEETRAGRCDGDVARRCDSSLLDGHRGVVSEDCAAQGLTCVASEAGVGCGSVPEPELGGLPDAAGLDSALQSVQKASRPGAAQNVEWSVGGAR